MYPGVILPRSRPRPIPRNSSVDYEVNNLYIPYDSAPLSQLGLTKRPRWSVPGTTEIKRKRGGAKNASLSSAARYATVPCNAAIFDRGCTIGRVTFKGQFLKWVSTNLNAQSEYRSPNLDAPNTNLDLLSIRRSKFVFGCIEIHTSVFRYSDFIISGFGPSDLRITGPCYPLRNNSGYDSNIQTASVSAVIRTS